MEYYRKVLALESESDFTFYHQFCGNNAIRSVITHKALEFDKKDTLNFLVRNFFYDKQDIMDFVNHRHYNLSYQLLKKIKITNAFGILFCNSVYRNFYFYGIDNRDDMEGLQKCLLLFKEKGIKFYVFPTFFETLVNLYKKRIEKSKKIIFFYALRVVCNPSHPVGYRLILKEYNELYNSEEYKKLSISS